MTPEVTGAKCPGRTAYIPALSLLSHPPIAHPELATMNEVDFDIEKLLADADEVVQSDDTIEAVENQDTDSNVEPDDPVQVEPESVNKTKRRRKKAAKQKRRRGRPKGSTAKSRVLIPDADGVLVECSTRPRWRRPDQIRFRKRYCQELIEWMADGNTYEGFATVINTDRANLYKWETEYPEWVDAKRTAFEQCEQWWLKIAKDNLISKREGSLNSSVWIFNMKNRFKWTDRTDLTSGDESLKSKPIDIRFVQVDKEMQNAIDRRIEIDDNSGTDTTATQPERNTGSDQYGDQLPGFSSNRL